MSNVLNYNTLREYCDTCDSKNDKTPVDACVRARARKGDYRYFYNSFLVVFITSKSRKSIHPLLEKK